MVSGNSGFDDQFRNGRVFIVRRSPSDCGLQLAYCNSNREASWTDSEEDAYLEGLCSDAHFSGILILKDWGTPCQGSCTWDASASQMQAVAQPATGPMPRSFPIGNQH